MGRLGSQLFIFVNSAKRETVMDRIVKLIIKRLLRYLRSPGLSPYNYERYLLIDKAPYLDAFVEGKCFPPFEVEIQTSSKCNLQCRWCIGKEVQARQRVMHLANNIAKDNVDYLIDGIMRCKINGLGIQTVKFSGFIGEPLANKEATLHAIQRLNGAGFRVGLFTNGVLLSNDDFKTIANIAYVHISLDAGPRTFFLLKESPDIPYSRTFEQVLNNIAGLAQSRRESTNGNHLHINVGFVVVPANFFEIYDVTRLVKEAGADSIRFKCDIAEKHDLMAANIHKQAYAEIERARRDFHDAQFEVITIHSQADVEKKTYACWKSRSGCFFHNFLATVGSDGNLYLCDHNTMTGAIPLGCALDQPLNEIWTSQRRNYLTKGIPCTCLCSVCPPFANRANFFLKEIRDLVDQYGIPPVKEALAYLKERLSRGQS